MRALRARARRRPPARRARALTAPLPPRAQYFGRLAGGRIGGVMGGLGFILPGALLMLLFSWFYNAYGLGNGVFLAVFQGLQPAMCALVFRACYKIGDFAFRDHKAKTVDWALILVGGLAAFESVLNVNYFIAKAHLVGVYALAILAGTTDAPGAARRPRAGLFTAALVFWTVAPLVMWIGLIGAFGKLDDFIPMGVGVAKKLGNVPGGQFVVGLVAGLVTFGGAYTAIPFVQYEAVQSGAWIANQVFLDSLIVCSVLPTPMVMFILMVGYMSGAANGGSGGSAVLAAALMTLGMFIPAFIMPVCFGDSLERVVSAGGATAKFLDAVAATVVGQIAITALLLLRTAVTKPTHVLIFIATLHVASTVTHKYTSMGIVAAAAMAGAVLYY